MKFPIAFKLAVLSSAITIVSLGSMTALSTVLMTRDVQITAENHNYEVNRLAAERTEGALTQVRINAGLAFDLMSEPDRSRIPDWFFEDRREIAAAALFDALRPGGPTLMVLNDSFVSENGMDEETIRRWIAAQSAPVNRALKATLINLGFR